MRLLTVLFLLCSSAHAGSFADAAGTHYAESWTSNVRTPRDVDSAINPFKDYDENLSDFSATIENLDKYRTAILQVFGGREFDKVSAFLDAVQADQGVGLRAHMAAKSALTAGMKNVYWQVGNEINNGPKLSPSIHQWLGDGQAGGSNDINIIPTYVEMWLAPSVQGLIESDRRAQIILGSVANAAGATDFIEALLDYQIAGTYAPALAGKFVRDIVHAGSIHYSMFSADWQIPIDQFMSRGMRVWSTEEVGGGGAESGMCMPGFVRSIGRTLGYNPAGKVFVWGTWIEPYSCDVWMPILTDFFGDEPLKPIDSSITGDGLETYAFALGATGKTASFVSAPDGGTITGMIGTGTVYVFRASGVEQYSLSTSLSINLSSNDSAFIAVD